MITANAILPLNLGKKARLCNWLTDLVLGALMRLTDHPCRVDLMGYDTTDLYCGRLDFLTIDIDLE